MKKDIHLPMTGTTFVCASCNSRFEIASTLKADEITIDICSQCHPFYVGGTSQQTVKGRAEKLSSKFSAGKQTMSNPVQKAKPAKKQSNRPKTLEDL